MDIWFFFDILFNNKLLYLVCLFLSLGLFYLYMRKVSSSWFNPLRFNLLTFALGLSVVLLLFFTGYVSLKTFTYLICSVIIFWTTFLLVFKNKQRLVTVKFKDEPKFAKYLFYLSYGLYIFFTLLSYKLLGIPVFNEDSRIATYTGSGLGYLARITPVLYCYCLIYIMSIYDSSKRISSSLKVFILLIPIIVFGILSGSRSSFLGIIFAFWGYKTFYVKSEPKLMNNKWLLIPFLCISIYVFSISTGGDMGLAVNAFFERVVASGDLYWESLPNETWEKVVVYNPFNFTFMGILGPLRILDTTQAEIPIGFQLTSIIYPSIAGRSTGPVALFPIFGLVCFGYYGGLLFSFFQAILVASLLRFFYIKSDSIIYVGFAYYGFESLLYLLGDASAGLGALLNTLVGYAFMVILLIIVSLFVILAHKRNKP